MKLHSKFHFLLNKTVQKKFSFKLDENFIKLYSNKPVNFGFNGLGDLVYRRTYSRIKQDGLNEEWHETIRRVVEGTFNLLCHHYRENKIQITPEIYDEINRDSKKMYDKIFHFKFLPPGRGLWSMGTNITEKTDKRLYAALNNCAFVSTRPLNINSSNDIVKPYAFLMDCAMLGVGVGFDTKGAICNIKIHKLSENHKKPYLIEDSREGWVESVKFLLKAFLSPNHSDRIWPVFDYSKIRAPGQPLKVFGGVSSGTAPLIELHNSIFNLLQESRSKTLTTREIVDIMNLIGKSVIAGNISII
jgi:ribonucleoside-triphosphate reductase